MKTAIAELDQLHPPSEDGAISRALTDLDAKIDAWTSAVAQAQDRIASDMDGITELLEETAAAESRLATAAAESEARTDCDPTGAVADEHSSEVGPDDADAMMDGTVDAEAQQYEELESATDSLDEDASVTGEIDVVEEYAEDAPDGALVAEEAVDEDVPLIDASTMRATVDDEAATEELVQPSVEETGEVIEAMLAEFSPDVAERLKIMHATDESRRSMAEIITAYKAEMMDADELLADMDPEAAQAIRVQYRLFNGRKSIRELIDAYQPSNEQQIKAGRKKKSWWRS